MRISKRARYALRALAILASRDPRAPIQIHDLAETGRIPLKFLEQILLVLRRRTSWFRSVDWVEATG